MSASVNLTQAIAELKRIDIHAEIYWRSIPSVFRKTPLEWVPSFLDGNRYNPKEKFAALYFAGCEKLAEKETEAKAKPSYLEPREYLKFRININGVMDLTLRENLEVLEKKHKIRREDLIQPAGPAYSGYTTTQLIGSCVFENDIPGFKVLSSKENPDQAERWHNLVLFPSKIISKFISLC